MLEKTIKPCLILAGIITCGLGVLLISPQTMISQLLKLPFQENYTIIIQHWSFIITLVGIAIIIAAFVPHLRYPVLMFALIEKVGFVVLGLIHLHEPGTQGFIPAMIVDSIISLYLIITGAIWSK